MKQFGLSYARVSLVALMLAFSGLLAVPAVRAQTTSINNLSYPTAPVSDSSVRITYDVTYSSASSREALATYVVDAANPTSNPYASGTGSSTPDKCLPLGSSQFNDKAFCAWILSSNSGTEHLTFDLDFSTHRQSYSLAAGAGIITFEGTTPSVVYSSFSMQEFSITAGNQLQLTVNVPDGLPVTVDGNQVGHGQISLDLNLGIHSVSVPPMAPMNDLTQLKFGHWEDGSTQATRSVDLEGDTTLTATYVTQYKLILTSTVNATGEGWYDEGSTARFSVPQSEPIQGVLGVLGGKLQFKGWYEGGKIVSSTNAGTIQISNSHTLEADWQADYATPIAILATIIAVIGATVFVSLRRAGQGKRRKESS